MIFKALRTSTTQTNEVTQISNPVDNDFDFNVQSNFKNVGMIGKDNYPMSLG